jgi:hypothetical protein
MCFPENVRLSIAKYRTVKVGALDIYLIRSLYYAKLCPENASLREVG